MIYPKFLKKNDVIGITAPSNGMSEPEFGSFDLSEGQICSAGYQISETENVRRGGIVSSSGEERAKEIHDLLKRDEVRMILCASGGDFLIDMLPYLDYDLFAKHPKWIQGYSDPTNLLYSVTVNCDIATIYSFNGCGFDTENLHPSQTDCFEIWKGNIVSQHSFDVHENCFPKEDGSDAFLPVKWETPNGDVDISGRLMGGCVDCLCDFIGSKYDKTVDFVHRYAADGIIWYFDVFAMRSETVHNALWNMREAGWFENARGFMFGRVRFPETFLNLSYTDIARRILGEDVPLIMEADLGHVSPRMTLINGAMAHITAKNGQGTMDIQLIE